MLVSGYHMWTDLVVLCAHLRSSNSVHYLLWCCVQSMFSIINNNNNIGEYQ